MPDNCSIKQFENWYHNGLAFLEANSRWSQSSRMLHELRKSAIEIDDTIFKKAVSDVDSRVFAET